MASGNDATVQMAEVIAGSEEKFVKLMNKKVKELGLKNTKFVNCTGLDEDGHYSSAYDMAMIARDLVVNHPEILKFSSMYEDYLREDTDNKFWLVNTNKLVKTYEGADGLKTGHTDAAGYCLAATAKRNGLRLIGIVLGEKDSKIRNEETKNLLNYGFNTVKFKKLKEKGECVKKIRIEKADKSIVSVSLKDDLGVIEGLSSAAKYKYDIKMKKIDLPISKNTVVGKIYVKNKEKIVSTQDLIIKEDVNKLSFLQLLFRSIKSIVNGNF